MPPLRAPSDRQAVVDQNQLCDRDWYRFFQDVASRVLFVGTISFGAGAGTATVAFGSPQADTGYLVFFGAPEDSRVWSTSKTVNGFIANRSNTVGAAVYSYIVVRP